MEQQPSLHRTCISYLVRPDAHSSLRPRHLYAQISLFPRSLGAANRGKTSVDELLRTIAGSGSRTQEMLTKSRRWL